MDRFRLPNDSGDATPNAGGDPIYGRVTMVVVGRLSFGSGAPARGSFEVAVTRKWSRLLCRARHAQTKLETGSQPKQ